MSPSPPMHHVYIQLNHHISWIEPLAILVWYVRPHHPPSFHFVKFCWRRASLQAPFFVEPPPQVSQKLPTTRGRFRQSDCRQEGRCASSCTVPRTSTASSTSASSCMARRTSSCSSTSASLCTTPRSAPRSTPASSCTRANGQDFLDLNFLGNDSENDQNLLPRASVEPLATSPSHPSVDLSISAEPHRRPFHAFITSSLSLPSELCVSRASRLSPSPPLPFYHANSVSSSLPIGASLAILGSKREVHLRTSFFRSSVVQWPPQMANARRPPTAKLVRRASSHRAARRPIRTREPPPRLRALICPRPKSVLGAAHASQMHPRRTLSLHSFRSQTPPLRWRSTASGRSVTA